MYNLPNILTLSRIAVIPLIFVSIYFPTSFAWAMFAGALFIAASITDYLDGYLARAWNETSIFGRMLDSIADKLLIATALVVILVNQWYNCEYSVIPMFVILCREILVSGLREFMSEVKVGLPVTRLAKWKAGFQMVALAMMLFRDLWIGWSYLGEVLLWVAAILTFITGYQYYQKSFDYIKNEDAKRAAKMVAVNTKSEKTVKVTDTKVKAGSTEVAKSKKGGSKKSSTKKVAASKKGKKAVVKA